MGIRRIGLRRLRKITGLPECLSINVSLFPGDGCITFARWRGKNIDRMVTVYSETHCSTRTGKLISLSRFLTGEFNRLDAECWVRCEGRIHIVAIPAVSPNASKKDAAIHAVCVSVAQHYTDHIVEVSSCQQNVHDVGLAAGFGSGGCEYEGSQRCETSENETGAPPALVGTVNPILFRKFAL